MVHLLRQIWDNKTLELKYCSDMKDTTLSDLLRKSSIKTEKKFMSFSYSIWKYLPGAGRSTGYIIIFYRGGTINYGTHVPVPDAQSSAESDYNASCTAGMTLSLFIMLIHEFLNKDTDKVPYAAPLIILYRKSAVCMSKNGKYINHTSHIDRRVDFVKNCQDCKIHQIEWCEGGLQQEDIATKNVGENDLNPRMKYIMIIIDN